MAFYFTEPSHTFSEYLLVGKCEAKVNGRYRNSILADAVEAVIGAIFLDAGIEKVKELIYKKNPDIIAIPEMCYVEEMDDYYLKISKNKLIIAGSIYQNGINYTVVFSNKNKYLILILVNIHEDIISPKV